MAFNQASKIDMKNFLKNSFVRSLGLIIIVLCTTTSVVYSQGLGSPVISSTSSTIYVGDVVTYSLPSGYSNIIWSVNGGSPSSASSSTIQVTWNQPGTGSTNTVGGMANGPEGYGPFIALNVPVSAVPPPNPTQVLTQDNNNCDYTILTYSPATPPSGVTWYWQTAATGESTTLTGDYTVYSDGVEYFLKAFDGTSWSSGTSSIVADVNETPAIPGQVEENNTTSTSFNARWNSVSEATSYELDVSTSSSFSSFVSGYNAKSVTGTSHVVSGLEAGKNYYYRVRSKTADCESSSSTYVTAQTTILPPTVAAATGISSTTFQANWSSASGVSSYLLYVSESSNFSAHLSGFNGKVVTGTSHNITGLTPGKTYYFRLKSGGPNLDSGMSGYLAASTSMPSPTATTGTGATNSTIIANWGAVTGATEYLLDVSDDPNFGSYVGGYNDFQIPGAQSNHTVIGLVPGTTYHYRVKAKGANVTSVESNRIDYATTITPPTASQETVRTTGSFQANWSAVTGVTNYRLDVSTNSGFTGILSNYNNIQVGATNKSVTGLTPGKNYYYRVRSEGPDVNSINSSHITANTAIHVPTAVAETANTNTGFQANWTTVSGAVSYGLDVSDNSSFSSFLPGYNDKSISGQSTSSTAVSGLVAGKNYYFRVRARGEHITSTPSSGRTASTNIQAPATSGATSIGGTSFTANWAPVSGVSNYLLDISTDANFGSYLSGYQNLNLTTTSRGITGLSIGTTYHYRVTAVGGTTNSQESTVVTTHTTISTPTAIAGSGATTGTIQANWNAVVGATEYLLDVSDNPTFSTYVGTYNDFIIPGGLTSHVIAGLSPGTNYHYRLKAKGQTVQSQESNAIAANTLMTTPAVSQESAATDNSFQANWVVTPGASSYRLDVSTDSGFNSILSGYSNKTVNGVNHLITGLNPGKHYYYRLRAVSADNFTSASSTIIAANTTISNPVATTASNASASGIQANWNAVAGASSYRLDVSAASNFSSLLTGYNNLTVSGTSLSITGLLPGKNYFYRVRAVGDDLASSNSGTITGTTNIPAPFIADASGESQVGFQANWVLVSGVNSYILDVSSETLFTNNLSGYDSLLVTGSNHTVSGLDPGRTYYYKVRAVGDDAISISSPAMTAITNILAPVATAESSQTTQSFVANWNAVAGAQNYRLDVAEDINFTTIIGAYDNRLMAQGQTSLIVKGLDAGKNYFYRVRAEGDGITSANSNVITGTTVPDPKVLMMGSPIIGVEGGQVVLYTPLTYATYTWKKNGTTVGSGSTYTATSTGNYTLTITKSGISGSYTSAPITVSAPSGFNPGDENYVMSTTILVDGITTQGQIDTLTTNNRSISIQYADGLGRGVQVVGYEAAPDKSNIVQSMTYDKYGRQTKSYLPYVVTNNAGLFQHNPTGNTANYGISPQYEFYQSTANVAQDIAPYAESILEKSPLGRVLKQGAPGAAWQPVQGSTTDNVVRMAYEINAANDVRFYEMVANSPASINSNGYYDAGELTIAVTQDEEGNETVQYTDKKGQVIIKRVYTGDVNNPWAETQYVYDEYGNLRVVLPPEANKAVADNSLNLVPAGYSLVGSDYTVTAGNYTGGSYMYADGASVTVDPGVTLDPGAEIAPFTMGGDFLSQWAFQYKYDHRNRMSEKRVPGSGWVYMVYDKLDRLVATQDANQRANNQWTFTKYDVFSRPVLTGFVTNSAANQAAMQAVVDGYANLYESVGSSVLGYTNNAFPSTTNANDYLTATYYDDYNDLPSEFTFNYVERLDNGPNNVNVKGHVVGSQIKVLDGSNTWLKTAVYYDNRYRVILTLSDNHIGNKDLAATKYDFAGRVLETLTTHKDLDAATPHINISETFSYDHASRLLEATHQVNSEPAITMVKNEYNAIGELIDKKLHSKDGGANFEQSVDYRYNIRGWLERINDADLSDSENDYFGMELAYNNSLSGITSTAMFNGNISAAKWSNIASGGQMQSGYTYSYDAMNRLTGADYNEKESTWADKTTFDVNNLTYDLNGNIESLRRFATNTTLAMDHLSYSYVGNQLQAVTDNGNSTEGFKDGNTAGNDYAYDENGNMISDANKDITAISYNHLNLPKTVTFTGGRSITYTYDAAGIKLAKSTNDNGTVKVTDYSGGFIYEDNALQLIAHAEGRIRPKDAGGYIYDYYLKDHLGNSRVTFTTESEEVVYLATMETAHSVFEESTFLNVNLRETNAAANYTQDNTTNEDQVVRLRGNDTNRQVGPGKLMQVMPGDTVAMEAYAYHTGTYSDNGAISNTNVLASIISMVSGAAPTTVDGTVIQSAVNTNSAAIFVGGDGSASSPRAYLNYILFDQDFNYLDAGFTQVSGTSGTHVAVNSSKTISEKGYLYVYVSNESNNSFDVFFDDLRITHTKGRIMQEDHYYPFGMNINALSSTAPLSKPNQFKYNGKEEQDDFDLNLYDYGARFYDAVLGRWSSIDKESERGPQFSPYNYTFNNPIKYLDPDGNWPWESKGVRHARRFARATGGSFSKIKRRHRKSNGGAAAIVGIAGTTTGQNLRSQYDHKLGRKATPSETADIMGVVFHEGGDYSHLFAKPKQMLANGGAIMQLLSAVEGVGMAVFGHALSGSGGIQIDVEALLAMVLKSEDNSKNEKHGDADALGKVEQQIKDLEAQLAKAPNKKEKNKIKKKIQNVRQNAQKNQKGEEHSRKAKN